MILQSATVIGLLLTALLTGIRKRKTGDDRLSDMTVLFAHKDRPVDREKPINRPTFAERLDRRIQFS